MTRITRITRLTRMTRMTRSLLRIFSSIELHARAYAHAYARTRACNCPQRYPFLAYALALASTSP